MALLMFVVSLVMFIIDKKEIALASCASENTIMNAFNKFLEYKDIIPEQYKQYIDNLLK